MQDIPNYVWYYKATETGDIFSLNYKKTKALKKLIPILDNRWRYVVSLSKKWIVKQFNIHKLIADTFIPNPNNYPWVCHQDGNPLNNNVTNLYWWTAQDNTNDSIRHWTHASAWKFGFDNRLSDAVVQIDKNNKVVKIHWSMHEAAREVNGWFQNISHCCLWKRKSTAWFYWKFVDKLD